ncbi:PDR/VanB family oxidoreductase [Nocardia sp. R16R-3T]
MVDPDRGELLPFDAGSHVDLALPNGLMRSYSLAGSPSDRRRYILGVHRTPGSRGGSSWIHDNLRPGMLVEVSEPSNNFELDESAQTSILVAGGIGITPMLAMAHRLEELQRKWHLYYAVRERSLIAFGRELEGLATGSCGEITLHVDAEDGGVLDIDAIVRSAGPGTHVYCCGPAPMLAAFENATSHLDAKSVHVEYFTSDVEADTTGGFEIVLSRSDLVLEVRPGQTILETMQDAGVEVPFSCTEGICGTCETGVLEGIPDHRDLVLTESEKAANDVIFVCCSGSKSPRLVLDA